MSRSVRKPTIVTKKSNFSFLHIQKVQSILFDLIPIFPRYDDFSPHKLVNTNPRYNDLIPTKMTSTSRVTSTNFQ